ncbi:MAG: HAD family phosphatase [Anaerolineaceae bacterium]|nr:HAD family phosphatase [Anaerolineaceae bacterium]
MTIKALIWDMEGVLMLTDDGDFSLTLAKKLNAPYEKVREINFSEANDRIDLGKITQDQYNDYLLDRLQIPREKKYLIKEVFDGFYIDEDLLKKISEMREKYKIGLLSNYSNNLRGKIENEWGISNVFDEIVISCEVGMIKPDPAIFNLMLDRLEVKADETVFIDDRIRNIDGAKKMGFHTIFFTSKEQALKELARILQT